MVSERCPRKLCKGKAGRRGHDCTRLEVCCGEPGLEFGDVDVAGYPGGTERTGLNWTGELLAISDKVSPGTPAWVVISIAAYEDTSGAF
jgi:hypothetical protein